MGNQQHVTLTVAPHVPPADLFWWSIADDNELAEIWDSKPKKTKSFSKHLGPTRESYLNTKNHYPKSSCVSFSSALTLLVFILGETPTHLISLVVACPAYTEHSDETKMNAM